MSTSANPKLIGAFVLGAIILIIGALIVLGGGKFFQRTTPVVMYFQGSVAGLSAGSPVNFRGVSVGQVTNVSIRYQPNGGNPLIIPVFAELSSENVQLVATRDQKQEFRPGTGVVLRTLIDDGLRAQLAIPSLVTGQATVSLDLFPGSPAELHNGLSRPGGDPDRAFDPARGSGDAAADLRQALRSCLSTSSSRIHGH